MANYIPHARTNEFKVKDVKAFTEWMDDFDAALFWNDDKCTIIFSESIPSYVYNDETDEERDVDFTQEIFPFLADGAVAIVTEIGYEKMRYLVGISVAVNQYGAEIVVNLDDIYTQVNEIWSVKDVSRCEY
jgi:hypothetical protein